MRPDQAIPVKERLLSRIKVHFQTGCWLYTGHLGKGGYGQIQVGSRSDGTRKMRLAHVVSYETFIGPVPEGMELDHVASRGCRFRHCINPTHLEPVTTQINQLRGNTFAARNAAKTHCVNGHQYTPENTGQQKNGRFCIECGRIRSREWARNNYKRKDR